VNFKREFSTTPTLGVWILKIFPSIGNTSRYHCMSVSGENITKTGFTIIFRSSHRPMFYPVLIGWVASDNDSLLEIKTELTINETNFTSPNFGFISSICKNNTTNLAVPSNINDFNNPAAAN
jgi:hypothetical protein